MKHTAAKRSLIIRFALYVLYGPMSLIIGQSVSAQNIEWIRQLGSKRDDESFGVSIDTLGDVFTTGTTNGSLDGSPAGVHLFLSNYDAAGNTKWIRQLATEFFSQGCAASADGLGNAYVAGTALTGPRGTPQDGIVCKYDSAGNLLWTKHQAAPMRTSTSTCVSADALGSVYVAGHTAGNFAGPNLGSEDAYLARYDAAGHLLWARQFGSSSSDYTVAVSADGLGNAYVTGNTAGSMGGPNARAADAFVTKFDSTGNVQWIRQFGTSSQETGIGVSADRLGNVYISGQTDGSLDSNNAGSTDIFVRKFDAAGNLIWGRQFGTSGQELGGTASVDGLGNVFVSGFAAGDLAGPNAGAFDAFVRKYDSFGNVLWTQQLGTDQADGSYSVSADQFGHVYIAGETSGNFGASNAGNRDAFVAKIADVPEPTSIALATIGVAMLWISRRRSNRQSRSGAASSRCSRRIGTPSRE